MQKQAIHAWAAEICQRVQRGVRNEDSRVEFKSSWPDPRKAARRVAGHANSMRSEPILWVFGVDEKVGVIGLTESKDPGEWYASVRSIFDGVAPDIGGIVTFEFDGKDLVAIQLNTDSAPYVVKNISGDGTVQFEVPWRDGTLIRSAHQRELLQILLPRQRLPTFEVLEATLIVNGESATSAQWHADIVAFVEPASNDLVTVPFHRTEVAVKRHDETSSELQLTLAVQIRPVAEYQLLDHRRIWATASEAMIGCPGRVRIAARGYDVLEITPVVTDAQRRIVVRVLPTHAEVPRTFEVSLFPAHDRGSALGRWVYPAHRQDEPRDINMPRFNLPQRVEPPSFI